VLLKDKDSIIPVYSEALQGKTSVIIIEYGDLYNEEKLNFQLKQTDWCKNV
jgi:hypothetical protein